MAILVDGSTYRILTSAEIRFLRDYNSALKKGGLAQKLEALLLRPTFIGSFASDTAADASSHPGLAVAQFVPGDTYYDTTAPGLFVNTATTIGAATWDAVA